MVAIAGAISRSGQLWRTCQPLARDSGWRQNVLVSVYPERGRRPGPVTIGERNSIIQCDLRPFANVVGWEWQRRMRASVAAMRSLGNLNVTL